MENYFRKYKPFLSFLGKFFLSYLLLTFSYRNYLTTMPDDLVDGITSNVSFLTQKVSDVFGMGITTQKNYMDYLVIYHGKEVARIVEGCNAISVIILFAAFVIAFSGRLKPTLLFVLGGSFLIYVLNIFRIALLTVLVYHYPQQEHFLHGVVFPLIIYGVVFILWLVWVNNYSAYASGKSK